MDCDGIEIGFVINLKNLHGVLRELSADGTRWWLASDPCDAIEHGYISIGYGYPGCTHPANVSYYRIPVLSKNTPMNGTDGLVLVFDASVCITEQLGYYIEDGEVVINDALENFHSFYTPIHRFLVALMQARNGRARDCDED